MKSTLQRTPYSPMTIRVRWILALLLTMVLAMGGGYFAYRFRWRQNTLQLLVDARAARDAQNWEQAVTAYRYYVRRNPTDHNALAEFADALLARAKQTPETLRDAIPALRKLVTVRPNEVEYAARLTQVYLDLGQPTLAAEFAPRWLELSPNDPEAVLANARALYGSHRPAQAAELLKQALAKDPLQDRCYPPLIEILNRDLERPHEAEEWLHKALEAAPDSLDVQTVAFSFHQSQNNPRKAEEHLRRSLELAPDQVEVVARAAMFYLNHGNVDRSTELLKRGLHLAPQDRLILGVRAARAIRLRDHQELISTAQSLEQSAIDTDAAKIAQAAELYLRAGASESADRAIARLESIPNRPADIEMWLETLRGARHLLAGRPYTAIPLLDRSLRKQPSGVWPVELLALAYRQIGALEESASLYRRVVALAPDSVSARLALAKVELERGLCPEAIQQIQGLPPLDPRAQVESDLIALACALQDRSVTPDSRVLEDILTRLAKYVAAPPTEPGTFQLFAQCLIYAGDSIKAMELARRFEAPLPQRMPILLQIGSTMLKQGQPDLVLEWADELTRLASSDPTGYVLRLQALVAAGRVDEAGEYASSSSIPEAARASVRAALGEIHVSAGRMESGLAELRRAASADPQNITVRQILSRFVPTLEEAQKYCDEIRRLEGDEGVNWKFELAGALLQRERSRQAASQALELVRACLAIRPNWTPARLLLAYAQEQVGALADAADSYRTALTQQPQLARQPVALRFVEVLKRLGQIHEADTLVSQLVAALPDSPEVMRLEVERQVRSRNLSAAALVAERLLALKPDDPGWSVATADLQLQAGNPHRAEQITRDALAKHSDSISLLRSHCRALIAQQRSSEAIDLLQRIAETHQSPLTYVLLAEILSQLGQIDGAEQAVQAALQKAPEDPQVLLASSEFYGSRGNIAKQVDLARKAIWVRGEDAGTSLSLATLLANGDQAQRQEAEQIIRRRLGANPREVASLLVEAHLLATGTSPNLAAAQNVLRKAIAIDPQDPRAAKILAALQAQSGRPDEAAETLTNALAVHPDDPELLLSIAEISVVRGNALSAFAMLRKLLDLRPRHPQAQRLLVEACRQTGELDPCFEALSVIPDQERSVMEILWLAVLEEARNNHHRAEQFYQAAMANDPRDPRPVQTYAQFLASRGRCGELSSMISQRREHYPQDLATLAVGAELLCSRCQENSSRQRGAAWLEEIASKHPQLTVDASFRLGLCSYLSGDITGAETMFLKATQLDPRAARAVNALAWLYSQDRNQPQRALELIESYLAEGGAVTAEMLDTQAAALMQLRRFDAAKQRLAACLELAGASPTRTAATYRMGLLQMELDNRNEGQSYLRQALELDARLGGLSPRERRDLSSLLSSGGLQN